MKYTNRYNISGPITRAIENDPYEKGGADFSVTELISPARACALEEKHSDALVEDFSKRIWALFGQGVHSILERGKRPGVDIVETRYFGTFEGKSVSGKIDFLETDTGTLYDFKTSKAYPFTNKGGKGLKPMWIQQLNMQLELLRMNGLDANVLKLDGLVRDFDEKCKDPFNKQKHMPGYPLCASISVNIPVWPRERTQNFIKERVRAHMKARVQELPNCSAEETWSGLRCRDGYCIVAQVCDQYQQSKKTGLIANKENQ